MKKKQALALANNMKQAHQYPSNMLSMWDLDEPKNGYSQGSVYYDGNMYAVSGYNHIGDERDIIQGVEVLSIISMAILIGFGCCIIGIFIGWIIAYIFRYFCLLRSLWFSVLICNRYFVCLCLNRFVKRDRERKREIDDIEDNAMEQV